MNKGKGTDEKLCEEIYVKADRREVHITSFLKKDDSWRSIGRNQKPLVAELRLKCIQITSQIDSVGASELSFNFIQLL